MTRTADAVICGAGITGVSAAHFLSKAGIKDILLLDERPPLSLTSDRSTECYRNWWPDAEMLALMNRSVDLMEMLADDGRVYSLDLVEVNPILDEYNRTAQVAVELAASLFGQRII